MAAAVFAGCADLNYNEASNRDEDWTYNSPLNGTMSTRKCRANSRTISTVTVP